MRLSVLITIIARGFQIYQWILIIFALLTWLPGASESAFGQLINRLARPYLDIFDRVIPPLGPISFNVIIALFVLNLIQRGVIWLLVQLVAR